jgi:hypothetical protein
VVFSGRKRFGMVRPLHEEHFSGFHAGPPCQEFVMRKDALRLVAALLPAVIWIAAAPAGSVFA